MKSRIRTHKKIPREHTPDFSTAPAQPIFQSRPFVVQSKTAQQSQQPDLKTSLKRAQRYGHHLSRMQPAGVSAPKTVQPKQGNRQQVESESTKAPQALQAATAQLPAKTNVFDEGIDMSYDDASDSDTDKGINASDSDTDKGIDVSDEALKESAAELGGLPKNALKNKEIKRNSSQAAKFDAHAIAQGDRVDVAPGQDKQLPHEVWHLVQQEQRRVKPNRVVNGEPVNDDPKLEKEADVKGAQTLENAKDKKNKKS